MLTIFFILLFSMSCPAIRMTQHYVNVSCRLHNCHNSYILAIQNANTHQHYYKTVLLPFTFDTFQERMELHVGEWLVLTIIIHNKLRLYIVLYYTYLTMFRYPSPSIYLRSLWPKFNKLFTIYQISVVIAIPYMVINYQFHSLRD